LSEKVHRSDAASGSASSPNEHKVKSLHSAATGSSLAVQSFLQQALTVPLVWCGHAGDAATLGMLPCWGRRHIGDAAMLGTLPCWGCCHAGDAAMLGMLSCWGRCHAGDAEDAAM